MIIGLTGSLATGTSTAAKYLASYLNANMIDADRLAHRALLKNKGAYKDVIARFGRDILKSDGSIDRHMLAKKAFRNKSSLSRLCGILHPIITGEIKDIANSIYKKDASSFIIVDAPVLIESNFYKNCDKLIVVISSLALQLERAEQHKKIMARDALSRIRLQTPLHKKAGYADYIIDNNGDLSELKVKCKNIAKEIKRWQ